MESRTGFTVKWLRGSPATLFVCGASETRYGQGIQAQSQDKAFKSVWTTPQQSTTRRQCGPKGKQEGVNEKRWDWEGSKKALDEWCCWMTWAFTQKSVYTQKTPIAYHRAAAKIWNRNFSSVFAHWPSFLAVPRDQMRFRTLTSVFAHRTSFRAKGLRFATQSWAAPPPKIDLIELEMQEFCRRFKSAIYSCKLTPE